MDLHRIRSPMHFTCIWRDRDPREGEETRLGPRLPGPPGSTQDLASMILLRIHHTTGGPGSMGSASRWIQLVINATRGVLIDSRGGGSSGGALAWVGCEKGGGGSRRGRSSGGYISRGGALPGGRRVIVVPREGRIRVRGAEWALIHVGTARMENPRAWGARGGEAWE